LKDETFRKKPPLPYAVFLRDREGAGGWVLGVYRGAQSGAEVQGAG